MSIQVENVGKVLGEPPTQVLSNISLSIRNGEFVALTGRSGSGKSTLLYLLSSLDHPSTGKVLIDGHDIRGMNNEDLLRFRNEKMGFIFQFHYLVSELSALENVLLPTRKYHMEKKRREHAETLLKDFGLKEMLHRLPRQLSGGEQQRVAIARALVMEPAYLFADEPTGSLDSVNGDLVMGIIREANQRLKTTTIMVTHDPDFAASAERQIYLADGKIVG